LITASDLALKDKKKKIRRKTIHIVTGVESLEEKHIENIVINYSPTKLQMADNSDVETKPAKKPRKPRQSKKAVQLEIVEEA
jgi:hypothetical protein